MIKHYDKSDHKIKELYDAIEALQSRISFLEGKASDSEREATDIWRQVNRPITSYGAIKLDSITLDLVLSSASPDGSGNTSRIYFSIYHPKPSDYGLTALSGLFFCSVQFVNVPTDLGACIFSGTYQTGFAYVQPRYILQQDGTLDYYILINTFNLVLSSPKIRLDFSYIPYK
jgi:hypothetical protein